MLLESQHCSWEIVVLIEVKELREQRNKMWSDWPLTTNINNTDANQWITDGLLRNQVLFDWDICHLLPGYECSCVFVWCANILGNERQNPMQFHRFCVWQNRECNKLNLISLFFLTFCSARDCVIGYYLLTNGSMFVQQPLENVIFRKPLLYWS